MDNPRPAAAGHPDRDAAEIAASVVDARRAAWVALRDGLARFLRGYSRQYSSVQPEDVEDLASEKAVELLRRIESGEWDLRGRSAREVAGYLSQVSRNALVSLRRRTARIQSISAMKDGLDGADAIRDSAPHTAWSPGPDSSARSREFIGSLRDCLGHLQPRARRVWFFRVFYGMSSLTIGQHSRVQLKVGHEDVILQRTWQAIRACLGRKGLAAADMPAETSTALWDYLETARQEWPELAEIDGMGPGQS